MLLDHHPADHRLVLLWKQQLGRQHRRRLWLLLWLWRLLLRRLRWLRLFLRLQQQLQSRSLLLSHFS